MLHDGGARKTREKGLKMYKPIVRNVNHVWLASIWSELQAGNEIVNPVRELRGNALSYSGKYKAAFQKMLDRARAHGWTIVRTPGVHGGEWSARYKAVKNA